MNNPTAHPGIEVRIGAVALIDALGFKGIWKRYSELEVVAKLQRLSDISTSEAGKVQLSASQDGTNVLEFVRPSFLSDTVVFGVSTKPLATVTAGLQKEGWGDIVEFDDDTLAGEAVRIAAELIGALIREALEEPVPLAFRGAIAFGRFGMTDRFVIGPAIDEAAEWMNGPQGALVVLTPTAAKYPQAEIPSGISNLVRYSVPLKKPTDDKLQFDTLVVSPFAGVDVPERRQHLLTQLVRSFGPSPTRDVEEKMTNTLKFLDAAEQAETVPLKALLANAFRP